MAETLDKHNYTAIDTTIIADSLSPQGHRLTSFILTFPRMVLAEFNTHRALSRNSASSRAIPFKKMVKMVKEEPFIPVAWQKDHSGMQGTEYLTGRDEFELNRVKMSGPQAARELWLRGRDAAVKYADQLNEITGVTKQICNRMLEPYMWHTVIATGSSWENFFALRAEDSAEIHIQELAYKMLAEYNISQPLKLNERDWHIPFGDKFDMNRLNKMMEHRPDSTLQELMVKIATARCARISYNNFEGKDDYHADVKLHNQLAMMGHMSPFEHCAQVMTKKEYLAKFLCTEDQVYNDGDGNGYVKIEAREDKLQYGVSGNFQGFIQYRKLFKNETKEDKRVREK